MTAGKSSQILCILVAGVVAASVLTYGRQVDAAGTLFVSDTTTGPTDLIHAYDVSSGAVVAPDISLLGVTGLAVGPNGNLFAVTNNPGFQSDLGSVYQYDPATHAKVGGPYVTFNGQNDGHDVQGPEGMQFGATGNLYIADVTNSEVHVYGSANNSLGTLTSDELVQPTDVAFDTSGNLYVGSGNADILQSIGGTGPLTEFVPQLSGGLINPSSLAFGPDGKLYVLDNTSTPVVRRYDSSGTFDTDVISFSGSLGLFSPSQIAFGPDGKLYISGQDGNVGDGEILRFETNGTEDGPFVTGLQSPSFMVFTAVPEPASIVLLGLSTLVIAFRCRSRQKGNRSLHPFLDCPNKRPS